MLGALTVKTGAAKVSMTFCNVSFQGSFATGLSAWQYGVLRERLQLPEGSGGVFPHLALPQADMSIVSPICILYRQPSLPRQTGTFAALSGAGPEALSNLTWQGDVLGQYIACDSWKPVRRYNLCSYGVLDRHQRRKRIMSNRQLTVRGLIIGSLGSAVLTMSSMFIALKLSSVPWPIMFVVLMSMFVLKLCGHTNLQEINVTQTAMSAGAMVAGGLGIYHTRHLDA